MSFLDSLFSSNQTTTSTNEGYAPAMGVVDQSLGFLQDQPYMQAYGGPYAASMNPQLNQALNQQFGFGQATGAGGQFANQMNQMGGNLLNTGLQGYQDQLSRMQSVGAPQFQFDNQTYNTLMNNTMPGLRSAVDAQGRMSSQALQSNLGQLVSQANQSGVMGSNPLSKLGQGSAALTAQNQLNNQQFAANLYNQANSQANQGGMSAGLANQRANINNQGNILSGYNNLLGIGNNMMGAGYNAGIQNLGLMGRAAGARQDFNQFQTDMQRQQFMDQQTIPMQDALSRMNAAGNIANVFGTQTTNQTSTPSRFNQFMALGSAASGMPSAFGSSWGSIFGSGGGAAPGGLPLPPGFT